jgi:hypothetical protein
MATLQIDPQLPTLTTAQSLCGWRREFCVELPTAGAARIFVRAVERPSFKASELQRGMLFERLDSRFGDLEGFVEAARRDLEHLAETARRSAPTKANLYVALEYDRAAWERVQHALERWARR